MITQEQSGHILTNAGMSGEWTYSQGQTSRGEPARDVANHVGDCTDYVQSASSQELGSTWAGSGDANKANTAAFKNGSAKGYTQVEAKSARPGDVVVQGGHAGFYLGTDNKGNVWGLANNGTPATKDGTGYHDGTTTPERFNSGSFGSGNPTFYRPINN